MSFHTGCLPSSYQSPIQIASYNLLRLEWEIGLYLWWLYFFSFTYCMWCASSLEGKFHPCILTLLQTISSIRDVHYYVILWWHVEICHFLYSFSLNLPCLVWFRLMNSWFPSRETVGTCCFRLLILHVGKRAIMKAIAMQTEWVSSWENA